MIMTMVVVVVVVSSSASSISVVQTYPAKVKQNMMDAVATITNPDVITATEYDGCCGYYY